MAKKTKDSLTGKRIKRLRLMTPAEQNAEGWHRPAMVIELEDGTLVYPSQDEEGNGPGVFFGVSSTGETFGLFHR